MKVVYTNDLKNPHDVPAHYGMKSLDIHGMEPEGFQNILILGMSQFLPGGGAERTEIKADVIYYILEGWLTVITDSETAVLGPGDTVRFGMNEVREIKNLGVSMVKMLVIAGLPPK